MSRIRREPDEAVACIVESRPRRFDLRCALALGFRAETDFEELIRFCIEDELGGSTGAAGA